MLFVRRVAQALCLSIFFVSFVSGAPVLRVRADSWMPFNGTPTDAAPGYVVEMLRRIFAEKGVTVDYQTLAWPEALKQVHAGEIEAVIGANSIEAQGLVSGKEPIGIPRVALFATKASTWRYDSLASLRSVKIGVIAGYSYWKSLDEYLKVHAGDNVVIFSGDTPLRDGIKKLDTGEIDVMVETIPVFIWNVKNAGSAATNYRMVYSYEGDPIWVPFANNETGKKYAAWVDQGIREMRENGALEKLLKKYGLTDWQ